MFRKQGLTFNFSVARARPVYRWAHALALLWEQPLWSALIALVSYTLFSICSDAIWSVSPNAYYNYLADAFLHGQLYLSIIPPSVHDLSVYHGRLYPYWSPMPAIAMMPLVALFGVQVNDVILTLLIAALNVALVAIILRLACVQRVIKLSRVRRGLLVLCFALGTVHLTLTPFGGIWGTGQLFGLMCVALGYLIALRRRGAWAFVLVGGAFAAALLTRNHLVFAGLWPGCYLLYQHRSASWRRRIWYSLLGVLPIVLAVALLAIYN